MQMLMMRPDMYDFLMQMTAYQEALAAQTQAQAQAQIQAQSAPPSGPAPITVTIPPPGNPPSARPEAQVSGIELKPILPFSPNSVLSA